MCLRSKAVWGYDAAFLEACRDELTVSDQVLKGDLAQVVERGGQAAGFVELSLEGRTAQVEKLFVDPPFLGEGLGRVLFDWARRAAVRRGARWMSIEADPDAVGFYRHMGAIERGQVPSGSIPGRVLPWLRLAL